MPVYGLKGFFPPVFVSRMTRAILLVFSFFSCTFAISQDKTATLPYYPVTQTRILLWPNGAGGSYVVAEFKQDQWHFLRDERETDVDDGVRSRFKIKKNEPQFDRSNTGNAPYSPQLWQPDAQVIVVTRPTTTRLAVIAHNAIMVDEFPADTSGYKLTVTPALRFLQDATGESGMAALSSASVAQDPHLWLETVRQLRPLVVGIFERLNEKHWVLEQKLPEEELTKLTGGLEVQPSTQMLLSTSTSLQQNDNRWTIWLLSLILLFQIAAVAGGPAYTWLRTLRQTKPQFATTKSTTRPLQTRYDAETIKPILELVWDVIADIEEQQRKRRGTGHELEASAYQWVFTQYRAELERMLNGSESLQIYNRIRARFLKETFGSEDGAQVQKLVQIGRDAERSLSQIALCNLQSAELNRWIRNPNLLPELPGNLRMLDQKLTKLQDEIRQYQAEMAENEVLVAKSKKVEADLKQAYKRLDEMTAEAAKSKDALAQVEENRKKILREYHDLEEIVQRAMQLREAAKDWTEGKRKFLERTAKPQAAAALAFLIDYSFFHLAQAILEQDSALEAVMRANLVRISEQASAQQLRGFDRTRLGTAVSQVDSMPLVTTDRHLDREFFAYMMKMIREFGNLHLDFDFDVDEAGVHRVA